MNKKAEHHDQVWLGYNNFLFSLDSILGDVVSIVAGTKRYDIVKYTLR